jgi:hypothetical protein
VKTLVPIGRFSAICRLSQKALRLYDEMGLLRPAWVDPDSGYRYYALAQAIEAALSARRRGRFADVCGYFKRFAISRGRAVAIESCTTHRSATSALNAAPASKGTVRRVPSAATTSSERPAGGGMSRFEVT